MLAVPPEKPPPWIHTMTGSGRRGSVLGVYTLTTRQSSAVLVLVTPVPTLPVCAHTLPKVVVSLMPVHGAAGRGGRQRSAPTGGAAYGMPRNSRASAVKKPCTAPLSVRTTRGAEPVWECPAATAVPVAMPVSPTARPAAAASRLMDRLGAMACFISRHRELRPAASRTGAKGLVTGADRDRLLTGSLLRARAAVKTSATLCGCQNYVMTHDLQRRDAAGGPPAGADMHIGGSSRHAAPA